VYDAVMAKEHFIRVRTTPEERDRWNAAIATTGRDLSTVVRASLDRLTKQVEKKQQSERP